MEGEKISRRKKEEWKREKGKGKFVSFIFKRKKKVTLDCLLYYYFMRCFFRFELMRQ